MITENTGLANLLMGLLPISGNGSQVWQRHKRPSVGSPGRGDFCSDVAVFVYEAQNCCSHFFTSQRLSRAFRKAESKGSQRQEFLAMIEPQLTCALHLEF